MDQIRKTKIICTMGPSTEKPGVLEELMLAGMNVARFNFSHGDHEEQLSRLKALRENRQKLHLPVAALMDTKGPEIRLKEFTDGKVMLSAGQTFTLTTEDVMGDENRVSISYKNLPKDVTVGTHILIDDGLIEMQVSSIQGNDIVCQVINGGKVSNKKGVNVPNVDLSMEYISPKDYKDIVFAVKEDFDFIAASFVRTAADVKELRDILHEHGGDAIKIIAKIENNQGIQNIDEIIEAADGIMVARGDMGVEIPMEDVPVIQKMIIKKAYNAGKVVVTATQMLDSMMTHPRPTRAEATDVANAIYDGTSAIMLSGETAAGDYPVEAVKTMDRIAMRTEQDINYLSRLKSREYNEKPSITDAISHTACMMAGDLDATSIVTVTKSGRTARMISKYRPQSPIIGGSLSPKVCRQLNLSWGVIPLLIEEKQDADELFEHAMNRCKEEGLLEEGDTVVLTAGVPLGIAGTTNLLKAEIV
ncbi:MAG: pyruvate kinase [Lachnospiraceae bacterium]|nr:pyruvate kinase [Lachnospiraceae bacterium]MDD6191702.1 pyruvate kinase [Lachnospiraceae bacterium]MDY4793668.1 pyruvate kinase [Pararoseburia sp.]